MLQNNTIIKLNLGISSYPILIGINNLKDLGRFVKEFGDDVFLISHPRIYKLYGRICIDSLRQNGIKEIFKAKIPEGEENKSLENWQRLLSQLISFDNGLNKKIILVNLGGGVIGDLGGFAAACFKRGISYIQVPTTLLSMVDSGAGGKVGINFKNAKNIIGAFYQPRFVLVDLTVLKTLPRRELSCGLAEVVKYGLIADPRLFSFLEKNYSEITQLNFEYLKKIVRISCKIKAKIVEKDERDKLGIRVMLNFGHTLGHALEAATGYKRYHHGEAVALGMVGAAKIALGLQMLAEQDYLRIEKLLKNIGLPVRIRGVGPRDILDSLRHDKKFIEKRNRFVLPCRIGKTIVKEDIPQPLIEKAIVELSINNYSA